MNKVIRSTLISLAVITGLLSSATSSAMEPKELARILCEGNREGIAGMAKSYQGTPTEFVAETLRSAFEAEPHEATRGFMTEVITYVIDRGDRGIEYLESDRFMQSCLPVMNQKLANTQAQNHMQIQEMNENTVNMLPQQDQMVPREDSRRLDVGNRR